jgi:hypothetical protein
MGRSQRIRNTIGSPRCLEEIKTVGTQQDPFTAPTFLLCVTTNMPAQDDLAVAAMLKFNKEQKEDLMKLQANLRKAKQGQ